MLGQAIEKQQLATFIRNNKEDIIRSHADLQRYFPTVKIPSLKTYAIFLFKSRGF